MARNFLVCDSLQELENKVPLIIQFRESLGFWMRGTCPQGEESFHHRFRNLMEDVKLANRSGDVIWCNYIVLFVFGDFFFSEKKYHPEIKAEKKHETCQPEA